MNWIRILLAALAAFVAYFVFGAVAFTLPGMKAEYSRFPAVYRQAADIQRVFPIGMAATLVALLVLAVIYAKGYEGGNGVGEGFRFGVLVGIFGVCSFVLHNYVNLNIDLRLTLFQAAAYFVEWLLVGVVIGAVYKPAVSR
jgi:hypothetical protein